MTKTTNELLLIATGMGLGALFVIIAFEMFQLHRLGLL